MSSLNLSNTDISYFGLDALRGLPLTDLSLEGCWNRTIDDVDPLQGMPLTALNLGYCAHLFSLDALRSTPLATLNLTQCSDLTNLDALRGLPLTSLNLSRCDHLVDCIPALGAAPIRILDLSYTVVTDVSLAALRKLRFLTELNLFECNTMDVSADGFEALRGLPLSRLNLGVTIGHSRELRLRDEAMDGLQGLPLSELDLQNQCLIVDLGILPLIGMPLRKVNFRGCSKVSDEGLAVLGGMPHLQVVWLERSGGTDVTFNMLLGMGVEVNH